MTASHSPTSSDPDLNTPALLQLLRRKEGNWVIWGQTCQQLQTAGYSPQSLFEETGFEPIHQNQVIVAAQVYAALVTAAVPGEVLDHFATKGSDVLYEFRILNQAERVEAATLAVEKHLDAAQASDVAKAMREYSRVTHPPQAFTAATGDRVAYRYWRLARQQEDLQERSRLIARGLSFVSSAPARQAIEDLLTDFTVTKVQQAPALPVYRLESETELPRMLPCVGTLPLPQSALDTSLPVITEGPFATVTSTGERCWVAIPGWQVILQAEDPVALLCDRTHLPTTLPGDPRESILLVIDRSQQQWDINSHFLVSIDQQLEIQWFAQSPQHPLLGRVILALRPKKILDEDYTKELWQLDE